MAVASTQETSNHCLGNWMRAWCGVHGEATVIIIAARQWAGESAPQRRLPLPCKNGIRING